MELLDFIYGGKMKIKFEKFGFYKIDIDYLKFLHSKDEQVFYSEV